MSMESVMAFFEKMISDDDFAMQIIKCKDTEERIALAKSAGFDFDTEEITSLDADISQEELNALLEC